MSVLGIDQSLRATGIFSTKTGRAETITTEGLHGASRVNRIKRRVLELVDQDRPLLVLLEGYAYGGDHRYLDVIEVGGVLKDALFELEVPTVIVPPARLKKFATGSGRAEKRDMADAARATWKRVFGDDNQCDAFWLSMVGQFLLLPYGVRLAQGATLDQYKILRAIEAERGGMG